MSNTPLPLSRLRLHYPLWRFTLAIGLLIAVLAAVYFSERNRTLDKLAQAQTHQLNAGTRSLQELVAQVTADLRVLARLPALQAVLSLPPEQGTGLFAGHSAIRQSKAEHGAWQTVNDTFRVFSAQRAGVYDQVRYLDAQGHERIRINYREGRARIVPPEGLSDKSTRDYFKQALAAPTGHIVITPVELNIERGHFERPLKPVIRFALRVQDHTGRAQGVVIINYLATALRNRLDEQFEQTPGTLTLVDEHGHLFIKPGTAGDWSFLLPPGWFLDQEQPQVWQQLQTILTKTQTGMQTYAGRDGDNLYRFAVLAPNALANTSDAITHRLRWVLLSRVDHSVIDQAMAPLVQRLVLFFAFGFLLIAAAVLWQARNDTRTAQLIALKRRSEQERQAKDRLLNLFIWNVPAAVAMFDRDLRYIAVSRRWYEDYRLTDQDIIGKCHYEVFPEIPERWKRIHQSVLAGAVESSEEDPFTRQDGSIDWIRWEVRPWLLPDNSIGGIIMLTENVSERKRQNALQEEFIAKVSHELRTPLTVIHGIVRLLRGGGVALDDVEAAHNLLHTAERNADRLLHLVNDLLDLQRVKLDRFKLEHTRLPIATVIGEAVEANRSLSEDNQVQLEFDNRAPQVEVLGDAVRLGQVITNLLANAIRYSPQDGIIRVRVDEASDGVWVSVEDQGPGIPAHLAGNLFDEFTQGEQGNTRIPGGSGLGLAISKTIIERLGGSIGYENLPQGGARIYFHLPVAGQHALSS